MGRGLVVESGKQHTTRGDKEDNGGRPDKRVRDQPPPEAPGGRNACSFCHAVTHGANKCFFKHPLLATNKWRKAFGLTTLSKEERVSLTAGGSPAEKPLNPELWTDCLSGGRT